MFLLTSSFAPKMEKRADIIIIRRGNKDIRAKKDIEAACVKQSSHQKSIMDFTKTLTVLTCPASFL